MQQGASTQVRIVFVAGGTHNLENRIPYRYRDQELFQRHVDRSQQARQAGGQPGCMLSIGVSSLGGVIDEVTRL